MPESASRSDKEPNRKIRAHKKSRRGCGNCKLRAVKCDEAKPICKRCENYGVVCSYDKKSPDLEFSSIGTFHVSILNDFSSTSSSSQPQEARVPRSIAPSLKQGLAASLESHTSQGLDHREYELLYMFQTRTVLTITTARSLPIYQSSVLKYACSYPCLLHAVLTLTLMHGRHFSPAPYDTTLSPTEADHWDKTITLYNQVLSLPIAPASRDALWVTAMIIGILSITYVEAQNPLESWPSAPPSALDLNWLNMGEGKKAIWKDGKSFAEESDFRILAMEQQGSYAPGLTYGSNDGVRSLPSDFLVYFGIEEGSDLINNPYYAIIYTLAQTWNLDVKVKVLLNWLFFTMSMEPRYKALLEKKDPRALLLLAYWHRLVAETRHWYLIRRVCVECESICIYLRSNYGEDQELQNLLTYPEGIWVFGNP